MIYEAVSPFCLYPARVEIYILSYHSLVFDQCRRQVVQKAKGAELNS